MGHSHLHYSRASVLPRKGRRRLRGYKTYIDHTGLVHVVPTSRRSNARRAVLFPFVVLLGLLLVFKALAMINVGLNDYTARVAELQAGTFAEQAAAWVLMQDPASKWLYTLLQPLFG